MNNRAPASGVTLSEADATVIKGMLARGDRQHDIAAWFGVNGGRIGEIATGQRFHQVSAAPADALPPPGPYKSGKETAAMMQALRVARSALDRAEALISARP